MRAKVAIFIVLLYLVGTVAAVGIPDTILVTSSKNWIVANRVDQTTLTITVTNTTPGYNGPVEGKTLDLYVDPLLGTISPIKVTTNQYGIASSTFTVSAKSGEAQITATIHGEGLSGSTIQHIDHDIPYIAYFSYPLQGEVNAEIPFNISMTDRWGNPVDSRKEVASGLPLHSVTLHVNGPPPNDCGFPTSSGYIHNTSATLNPDGNVSAIVKLTSRIGNNFIYMEQFGSISEKIEWIVVESTGVPSAITGTISDGGILPVDTSPFIIDYFLYDLYGNPVRNRSIWVNTTPVNEQKIFTTNSLGRIRLYYGPMMTASDITITATSVDNSSVMNQLGAHFVYSGPTNMVLTITPQTMASGDASTSDQVFVRATVIDNFGNPVPNEPVLPKPLNLR
jgi:hypothetical protein